MSVPRLRLRGVVTFAAATLCVFPAAVRAHPASGIVVDRKGNVFFCDFTRNRILKVAPDGTVRVHVEDKDGRELSVPHHLTIDGQGNLYTASDRGGRVWRIAANGKLTRIHSVKDVVGGDEPGLGGDPVTVDPEGNVVCVLTDRLRRSRIVRIDPAGQLTELGGGFRGMADGTRADATFGELHDSTFVCDSAGNLYLTDSGTAVRRISRDGTVTTLAGGPDAGFADGRGRDARFRDAMGLALDAKGNLFIADLGNARIRKIAPDGRVSTLAGSGANDRGGTSRPATFERPSGVAVAGDGTIYVLEFVDRDDLPCVWKITPGGDLSLHCMVKA
jgi:sugar lactone lactonase YvrE